MRRLKMKMRVFAVGILYNSMYALYKETFILGIVVI